MQKILLFFFVASNSLLAQQKKTYTIYVNYPDYNLSAKTPLVTAIELVKKMIGFYPIEVSLDIVREDIVKGQSLEQSMSKFKIYNKRLISLIRVAEEVNQLDIMFGRLANQYSDEVEYQTGVLGSVIEPIMILFLGALVAIILIAMYLPMFQMSTSM